MTDTSQYDEALNRLNRSDWQRDSEGRMDTAMHEAVLAQAHASLAIADELRRLNNGRDQFHAILLDFLERITEDPQPGPDGSPVGSGQPAAASGCPVCARPFSNGVCPNGAPLTWTQWRAHSDDFAARLEQVGANRLDAALWSEKTATNWYGPCPEES